MIFCTEQFIFEGKEQKKLHILILRSPYYTSVGDTFYA